MTLRLSLRATSLLGALLCAQLAFGARDASAQVRPRFMIAFDTSGSMAVDLNDIPTYGDGIVGPTQGIDTNCDGLRNDSRLFVAKEALRDMLLAYGGDLEFGLARFPQYAQQNVICSGTVPAPAPFPAYTGIAINDQECNTAPPGPYISSMGDPTLNGGPLLSLANCGAQWDLDAPIELPIDAIPAACRPTTARRYTNTAASPNVCLNYLGSCPGFDANPAPGAQPLPDGDILVGFSGNGWPAAQDNVGGILKWVDNSESAFGTSTTTGNYCNHAGAGNCELRAQGPTPISGILRAVSAYMTPIRMADASASCRPYSVILITDGAPNCDGSPAASLTASSNAAAVLNAAGINTYVIGVAIDAIGRSALNTIATSGGTDAGAVGGDTAYFANDRVTLAAGISEIVRRSLRVESCNNLDDNCNVIIDEGLAKFCNTASGMAPPDCSNSAVSRPLCTLCAPPVETACDGFDNNCNGLIDEGVRNACGVCGPTPAEICDTVDNDCDGVIDEGGVCAGCIPTPEICDGIDNDCDLAIDEAISRPCGSNVGRCTVGTQVCAAGSFGTCSGIGPTAETCNNIDDDCDGVTDGITRACGSDVGACQAGAQVCTTGSFGTCTGAIGPAAETCNGIDDDCDAATDEGNPGGGGTCGSALGECLPGTLACTSGMLVCTGGRSAVVETCNSRDDDCDGSTDEGVPTMGACGSSVGECRPGVNSCVGGAFVCTGGRTTSSEVCDGRDNDCDASTDEGNPGGGVSCGTDTGICARGTTICTAGALACTGGAGPGVETCNALDDDCDGLTDEGNPGGGAACGLSTVGECEDGALACVSGALSCVGAAGPTAERCDNLDNNCDGMIDEGNPEGGTACGDDTGECTAGSRRCAAGVLVCEGGTGPTLEICNALDDDCDGAVDEGLGVGAPCGSDVGECSPGVQVCRTGAISCEGQITPTDEVCNALDDDCDGEVDEGLPTGMPCGSDIGACMPGLEQCSGGRLICVGETPAGREGCDCVDNDCDGETDEPPPTGALCPAGSECVECGCSRSCEITEFGPQCPTGRTPFMRGSECFCVEPRCEEAACGATTVEVSGAVVCAPSSTGVPVCTCSNNVCTFPCEGVVCSGGTVCRPSSGECVEDNCRGLGCPGGEICNLGTGACAADPCATVSCEVDEACRAGSCETSCSTVTCPAGERCTRGLCVEDRCSEVLCPAGRRCDATTGVCEADPCLGITCTRGLVCEEGACVVDPCTGVRCPDDAVCRAGECLLDMPPPDMGVDGGPVDLGRTEDRVLASGGGGCICAVPGAPASGGTGNVGGLLVALAALGLLGVRRRRVFRGRGARALGVGLVATVAMVSGGCDVDPYCLTCGDEVDAGADLGSVDLGVDFARIDLGVDLGEEPDGCVPGAPELCNGVDDNCDGVIDEGVDTTSDPNNCGSCGMRCEIPRAFVDCVASTCTLTECDVGFYNLDGVDTNGCEYRCIPTETNDAVCDLRDNDCDGEVDEDVDFQADPINCGSCARTCRFARAVAGCTAGECLISACETGFYNLDGFDTNGCEYSCTPAVPAVETCNGRDDDCDGMIDEGDPEGGGVCGSTTGACETGIQRCVAGALSCTGEIAPVAESCNAIDDDCDGTTDEGNPEGGTLCGSGTGACERGREVCTAGALVCTGGVTAVAELCNGIDDDCDGTTDDGNPGGGVACGPSAGACTAGATQCRGGVVLCEGAIGPTDELCNGLDDDCDGTADEGNPGGGSSCGTDVGQCNPGTQQCVLGALSCVGATGPATELCNGLDDDCDAMIDDGVASSGSCGVATGECATGALQCLGGTFQCIGAVGPQLEVCNTRDDDCDGASDEGFALTSDPRNCGACGNVCAFANAIAGCAASACTLVACNTGYVNLDGLATNGCEYRCDVAGSEICNGRDDDCDGATDETLTAPANFCNPNGVCAGTAATCSGATGWVCNYPPTYEPTETRCDALDNDCDGATNEPFPLLGTACANGVGACRRTGTNICNAAQTSTVCNAPAAGTAVAETCNNVDDNCNGVVDDAILPANMATVRVPRRTGAGFVSVMQYEASRADANATTQGSASRVACSTANVIPWTTVTWTEASAACCALNASGTCSAGTGWRLCEADDWEGACEGPGFGAAPVNYCQWSYGAGPTCRTSSSIRCNGDEFDSDGAAAGDQDRLFTTGSASFPMCYTEWTATATGRVFDMSGNVKEWTNTVPPASTGIHYIRGGSFNNVEGGRTCQFDFPVAANNFAFPNTGFRCCYYE